MKKNWPEKLAEKIIKERKKKLVVSTMVTPSGPIHLGNLREVLTGYFTSEALKKQGKKISFIFLADNFDYLRRVYPFLSQKYQRYVGTPLSEIPDLEGCHKRYDQHFLDPLFKALGILEIKPRIYFVSQLYKKGIYTPLIKKALENRDKIAKIISKLSGRDVPKDWSSFMPLCSRCSKISETVVTGYDLEKNKVTYQCKCGNKGEADYSRGEGKLVWRVHWPATWKIFKVDVEGFGKDLATKGGAYETGKEIVKDVFEMVSPFPIPYEWIYMKGKGRMASSTGVGFIPLKILEILPPGVLKYFYYRSKPDRHLYFDPKMGVVSLWNEFLLTKEGKKMLSGIPFGHLAMVTQFAPNFKGIIEALKRTGYENKIKNQRLRIKNEIKYIKNWLKKYAPADFKFEVQGKLPRVKLTKRQKEFLSNILKIIEKEMLDGERLHQELHQIKKEMKIDPRKAFSSIYLVFLGKDSGPQAGWFLASLDREFVVKRLKEAIK